MSLLTFIFWLLRNFFCLSDTFVDGFEEEGRYSSGKINVVPPNYVLIVDVVLVSFKPVIDVVGDSKIFKKILRDGEGTSVEDDGASVTGTYVFKI